MACAGAARGGLRRRSRWRGEGRLKATPAASKSLTTAQLPLAIEWSNNPEPGARRLPARRFAVQVLRNTRRVEAIAHGRTKAPILPPIPASTRELCREARPMTYSMKPLGCDPARIKGVSREAGAQRGDRSMRATIAAAVALLIVGGVSHQVRAAEAEAPPLQLEATIPLGDVSGRIDHMAVDIKRQRLFVAELGNNTVVSSILSRARSCVALPG